MGTPYVPAAVLIRVLALATVAAILFGCESGSEPVPPTGVTLDFDFRADTTGWRAGLADYPEGREKDVGFVADHRPLPDPLGPDPAFYHRGVNISDDLFMYFVKRVTGLSPATSYRASFLLEFASNYGQDCTIGVGGSVFLKAGVSAVEPAGAPDSTGVIRLNIDKGNQQQGGQNAVLLGDVRNGEPGCSVDAPFAIAVRDSPGVSLTVQSDDSGGVWILFGSESAFESAHELYFTRLLVDLERK